MEQKKLEADKRSQKIFIVERIKTVEEISQELTLSPKELKSYEAFYNRNHSRFQFKNMLLIFTSFALNQTILFMRSSKYHDSIIGLNKCSTNNNIVILLLFMSNILFTLVTYYIKRNEEYHKDLVHYRPDERYFTPRHRFLKLYLGGWIAGFSAGLIGIGSGIIMVSFCLSDGIVAREAASIAGVSQFMISLNGLVSVLD